MTLQTEGFERLKNLFEDIEGRPQPYSPTHGYQCLAVCPETPAKISFYRCGEHGVPIPLSNEMGKGIVLYWPNIAWADWLEAVGRATKATRAT